MADASLNTSAAIIKTLYRNGDCPQELYGNNNFFMDIPKETDFVGDPLVVAVQTEHTQGASATFSEAITSLNPNKYARFSVSSVLDYSLAQITGEAMVKVVANEGALVDLWKREMDGAFMAATRSLAIMGFRSGTGDRGQISAGSNVATNTITLAQPTEITNFAVNMRVTASATAGGATRNASAAELIAGINRATGTLTSTSVAWNTVIAALAAGDFLQRAGDAQNGGTALVITGLAGWIPGGATPGTLFGLNRNTDPVRLAGTNYDATGLPPEEALIEAVSRVQVEGGKPDRFYCHPRDKASLVKSLETKSRYMKGSKEMVSGTVGFDVLEFETDNGPVKVVSDLNCQRNKGWLLQRDTWALESAGKAPRILNFDDNTFLRVSNADSYQIRVGSYPQQICRAPAWNLQISNFAA